jgi:uncharacterized membrane protein YfcA
VSPLEGVAVLVAGIGAGTVNAVVGSGSLLTFPTLLAVGYEPRVASVSNSIGLVPGGVSAVVGYRRELRGQGERLRRLATASACGGLTGAILLLALPESVFNGVVPVLVLFGVILVIVQPFLARRLEARRSSAPEHGGALLWTGVFLTGIYGGYFAAAQGVILLGILGILLDDRLPVLNGVKNALVMTVNAVAAVVYVLIAEVAWEAVALIAIGAVIGGQVGAAFGRRLPPNVLRALIVVVGLTVVVTMLFD